MKKTYLLILASMLTAASFAQGSGKMVIGAIGGTIGAPGGVQLLQSVGEPIAGMIQTKDAGLSQGFLTGTRSIVNTETATAIDEVAAVNATVYPNPFTHVVHVNSLEDNIHIYVFNMIGQEVYNAPYQSSGADLSSLAPGVYIIKATSNDKSIINTKILKQ